MAQTQPHKEQKISEDSNYPKNTSRMFGVVIIILIILVMSFGIAYATKNNSATTFTAVSATTVYIGCTGNCSTYETTTTQKPVAFFLNYETSGASYYIGKANQTKDYSANTSLIVSSIRFQNDSVGLGFSIQFSRNLNEDVLCCVSLDSSSRNYSISIPALIAQVRSYIINNSITTSQQFNISAQIFFAGKSPDPIYSWEIGSVFVNNAQSGDYVSFFQMNYQDRGITY